MNFEELINRNHDEICKKWEEKTLSTYSAKASNFYIKDKNQFSNPVGSQLRNTISACVKYFGGVDSQK